MSIFEAIILASIEGITEFLPISSTGHLIVASHFSHITDGDFATQFNVIIQFGAILSVLVLYWRRLKAPLSFYYKIIVGFLPAAVIGLLVKEHIDLILTSVTVVAVSLIIGGVILIWTDRKGLGATSVNTIENMSYKTAFLIGLCQCVAFIPGVSRSAASILGGLFFGLNRKDAAEYSFFLAVPTLMGATLIKTIKIAPAINTEHITLLLVGIVVAFVVAALAIKTFIGFISRRGFTGFGIYRIVLGVVVLLALLFEKT